MEHIPVLLDEVLEMSGAQTAKFMLDGTFGRGGHAAALMNLNPQLKVIALDRDIEAIEYGKDKFKALQADKKIFFFNNNYDDLDSIKSQLKEVMGEEKFDLILLDLGVSSPQLDTPGRGFSFYHKGPLDMRMDLRDPVSAKTIINEWSEDELSDLFFEYGEVRRPGRVVKKIIETRKTHPIETTSELSELIEKTEGWRTKGKHPATKYFLALRLVVNKELEQVKSAIPKLINELADGGRMLVITFHSTEDRIVKNIFKEQKSLNKGLLVNKKVIQAKWNDQVKNPRARSAKLRVFQRSFHES